MKDTKVNNTPRRRVPRPAKAFLCGDIAEEGRMCGMTFLMALKHIRQNAPETEGTFRIICQNRRCHPVRECAIYDLAKQENLSSESAKRRYNRHLMRLHEIFGVPLVG